MQRVPYWRIAIVVAVLLLSLWKLSPTYQFYSIDPELRNMETTPEIQAVEEDIQKEDGNVTQLQEKRSALKRAFRSLRDHSLRLGLDLQGGVHMVIEVDLEKFKQQLVEQGRDEKEIQYALDTVLDSAAAVIENRVDSYGVAEAAIIKQPPARLVVEMPGYSDPEAVEKLINAEAQLSFHLVPDQSEIGRVIADIDAAVPEDFQSLLASRMPSSSLAAVAVRFPDNVDLVDQILNRPEVQPLIPRDRMFRWSEEKEPSPPYFDFTHKFLYLLDKRPQVTGSMLDSAWVYIDPQNNKPEVSLTFNRDGATLFRRTTADHVKEHLAILMDDRVYSAPVIQNEIRDGRAVINGIDDMNEARQIAVVLRAGALPAPLRVEQNRVVGPSLGRDSIQQGVSAGLIGAAVVIVFMVIYYAFAGVLADLAVIMNLVMLMAAITLFNATLTLPGIAGFILIIGMAVDANVLIYERMREELKSKRAKTVALVLDKAYGRAFMTIFDANLTTLITALVLFQFGTGPIKGFAVTLSLGIIISMFTAIFVTRVVYDVMAARGLQKLSLGSLHFFDGANFNFLQKPALFLGITFTVGVAGMIYLGIFWQDFQGIDFAGGSEIVVEFQQPTTVQSVRTDMATEGMADAVIQEIYGGEGKQYLIRVQEGKIANADELFATAQKAFTDNPIELLQSDMVGSKVGGELLWQGLYCLIFSSIGILLYITARFEFRFAVAAVLATFHDLMFTLAILAFTHTEFNLPIIAALLTILGYSLNDTIIVFDRIRENYTSAMLNFRDVVNESINQTLSRTVITSMTTLFVIICLYVLGGPVIHDFSLTLLVGVVAGTYSSIFVASPILLFMGKEPKTQRREHAAVDSRGLDSAAA
ncbi:MAG: protein translocase subunit SecD [bacterium]|nr:protein translocase subunit SecD [bacterium]